VILRIILAKGDSLTSNEISFVLDNLMVWSLNQKKQEEVIDLALEGQKWPFDHGLYSGTQRSHFFFHGNHNVESDLILLEELGFIWSLPDIASRRYNITSLGEDAIRRIDKGRTPRAEKKQSNQIFVACAFGYEEIDTLYDICLNQTFKSLNCNGYRVDRSEPNLTITEAILDAIDESKVILADLTFSRPSVYFEAGYALSQGIPLLLTCRSDHYRGAKDTLKVHFDLEQFKISFWKLKDGEFIWPKGMDVKTRLGELLK